MRIIFLFSSLFVFVFFSKAQEYKIEVQIANYDHDTMLLANYYGDKQYIRDTAYRENGLFVFQGEKALEEGVYLLVLPPKNDIFEVIINEDQYFDYKIDKNEGISSARVTGNSENKAFLDYLNYLNTLKPKGEALNKQMGELDKESAEYKKLKDELDGLTQKLNDKKSKINQNHPNSVLSMLLHSSDAVDVPDFDDISDEEERRKKQFQYYKEHYYAGFDLTDARLIRTPFFYSKVENYVEKLTQQSPDSINAALDWHLTQFEPSEDMFRFFLISFLNKYASSKVVGFDAVYVHLVNKYYAMGKAPWTEEDQLNKIIKNAKKLEPILIGKPAPAVSLIKSSGEAFDLYDIDKKWIILYFWDPECGHCKKSIPKVIDFYNNYKEKDVEVIAVCTKLTDKVPECWEATAERGMDIWINAADPYLRSRYKQLYDITSTPQIFILDENKTIVSKKIGSDQLPDVMERLIDLKSKDLLKF